GGAILAQRVGGQVGVDDVGIESDPDNQASLVLGKYLSDRLYISYGISLAEAINTLKLRWTMTERWMIKAEAGQERTADIVYTLKKCLSGFIPIALLEPPVDQLPRDRDRRWQRHRTRLHLGAREPARIFQFAIVQHRRGCFGSGDEFQHQRCGE